MTDAPYLAHEHDELLSAAERMLTDAETAAPALVAGKKITQAEADNGIRVLRAIAAAWRRTFALRNGYHPAEPDQSAYHFEMVALLEGACRKATARLERARVALTAALPEDWRILIAIGGITRDQLEAAFNPEKFPEVAAFLAAERRHWEIEALLWNHRMPFGFEQFAEIDRKWRDERAGAEAA